MCSSGYSILLCAVCRVNPCHTIIISNRAQGFAQCTLNSFPHFQCIQCIFQIVYFGIFEAHWEAWLNWFCDHCSFRHTVNNPRSNWSPGDAAAVQSTPLIRVLIFNCTRVVSRAKRISRTCRLGCAILGRKTYIWRKLEGGDSSNLQAGSECKKRAKFSWQFYFVCCSFFQSGAVFLAICCILEIKSVICMVFAAYCGVKSSHLHVPTIANLGS